MTIWKLKVKNGGKLFHQTWKKYFFGRIFTYDATYPNRKDGTVGNEIVKKNIFLIPSDTT